MSDTFTLPKLGEELRVQNSGLVTLCRCVHDCLNEGRTAFVLVKDAESASVVRGLLPLFEKEGAGEEQDLLLPQWRKTIQDFRPWFEFPDREHVSRSMASLYALTLPGPHCVVASLESLLLKHVPLDFFDKRILTLEAG